MCEKCIAKLESIKTAWNGGLPKAVIVITGAKIKEANKVFKNGIPATLIDHNGKPHKTNAPAGTAVVLNKDFLVYMTGYDQKELDVVSKLMPMPHYAREADLLDKDAVKKIVSEIKNIKESTGLPVHLVHYGGASDTKAKLPKNSIFSHTWDIPGESIPELVANNCTTLLNISQEMHRQDIFKDQNISKIIFLNALAAVRTKILFANDAVQKGAGHSLVRSMSLDLTPEKIYITEIMLGANDTGFYDNPATMEISLKMAESLGYHYTDDTFPVFNSEVVGETVEYVLNARGNVRELAIMPFGQYPHLGA